MPYGESDIVIAFSYNADRFYIFVITGEMCKNDSMRKKINRDYNP